MKLEKWQWKRLAAVWLTVVLLGVGFLVAACSYLYDSRANASVDYQEIFTPSKEAVGQISTRSQGATEVTVGTYLENFRELNIKANNYRVVFKAWFKWKGDEITTMEDNFRIFKGVFNKLNVVKDVTEPDGTRYQLFHCDVTINKTFYTVRFPLESHNLGIYLESTRPIEEVVFKPDMENSSYNQGMNISGYEMTKINYGTTAYEYPTTHGDPEMSAPEMTSEFVTAVELNRSSWGVYLKCIIALFGTTTWVLLVLFLNTYHRIDPLSMIPAALFGSVSNIMVAANLLPDALDTGLIEFVNIWGVFTIMAVALAVININRIRSKFEDRDFAWFFGRIMFFTILVIALAGHLALPLVARIPVK